MTTVTVYAEVEEDSWLPIVTFTVLNNQIVSDQFRFFRLQWKIRVWPVWPKFE